MILKGVLLLMVLITVNELLAQSYLPTLLTGTWKVEDQDEYEHWDRLNDDALRGVAYRMDGGRMQVTEYLELVRVNSKWSFRAVVVGQNAGQLVEFVAIGWDRSWVFENRMHDFPQQIEYCPVSEREIRVTVRNDSTAKSQILKRMFVTDSTCANPNFDAVLAEQFGADDYGMKSYYLVLLKTGISTKDTALVNQSFRGHLQNINRLVEEGKLVVVGPLAKNPKAYRGIFILQGIDTEEQARELLQSDPAIKNRLLDYELLVWYGSAALPAYLPFSERIWRKQP